MTVSYAMTLVKCFNPQTSNTAAGRIKPQTLTFIFYLIFLPFALLLTTFVLYKNTELNKEHSS